ncbi:Uncharacterised protein [Mycobacteroides abscessus subsp. abscessus]|nr:Uncharacterised protein [Mycobacteroides abscessus subsp. abscessus]
MRGREDLGVPVAEVHRRIGGQAVQVTLAVHIFDPCALGVVGDDRQRCVVVCAVLLGQPDVFGALVAVAHRCLLLFAYPAHRSVLLFAYPAHRCHECSSSVQHLTDPPPLSSSERSTPIGSNPESRSCSANPVAAAGSMTWRPSETAFMPRT